jgi:beta-N-acetylhexosaminidase
MLYFDAEMALAGKIGQMLMVGLQGVELSRDERLVAEEYGFGNFVLLERNCGGPAELVDLCRSLWATGDEIPPFLAIDQEGGRVHRLAEPFSHFPAAAAIGRRGDPELAYRAGRATATELSLLGLNLNFAPVLDVNSNTRNPVIGDRSFATTPADVIKFSEPWIRGLRDGGVIPCGKHFPGHGNTDKDSHLDLPVEKRSLEELTAVELPPFVHACRNRIEALMTAHVLYPGLDTRLPATLSAPIVTGLLREQLGYDGVVFSDDMGMKAIADHYGTDEAVSLSVAAGVDVLLYCDELPKAVQACEFLHAAAERDPAVRAKVETSYRRITALKRRFLKNFTGVATAELEKRLVQLDHQRIVDAIQGSL